MSLRPRKEIEILTTCHHGGFDFAELARIGCDPKDMLDFSVSANPFGPPPDIGKALDSSGIELYPDSASTEFRGRLAEGLGVGTESIIAGSGSVEIIRLAALAYLEKGDIALIAEPTFGEYEIACRIAGAEVHTLHAAPERGFAFSTDEIIDCIRRYQPKCLFLCNPNNPTGHYLTKSDISKIVSMCRDTLLILDEAYVAFLEESWNPMDMIRDSNIIIVRSMTKDYALAGLRLGYGVAHPEIIIALRKVCPPWNVNTIAQRAGVIALNDPAYISECQAHLCESRKFLTDALSALGMILLSSSTHFFLLKAGNAHRLRQELLKYDIMVRDCSSFGLPEYVRIASRTIPENRRLIDAIRGCAEKHPFPMI